MPRTMLRAALIVATLTSLSTANPRWLAAQQPTLAEEMAPNHLTAAPPQACPAAAGSAAGATAGGPGTRPPLKLFYNFYAGAPGVPAQLYPMPRPTPGYVGQVWITYPPLMPHEFLYHHHRRYYRYTPGGYTSASVRYSSGIMGFIPAF